MSAPSPSTQVSPDHYQTGDYLTRERWNSLWHQLAETIEAQPKNVLVVGTGDGVVSALLRVRGIETLTFDFDRGLRPDVVGDVREILRHVPPKSYDVVLCCQVLEHIPYDYFAPTLAALVAVARRRVIVSLPYRHRRLFELSIRMPRIGSLTARLTVPSFWQRWSFDGQHYWELGTRGFSVRRVVKTVERLSTVRKCFFADGNKYHYFMVLDAEMRQGDD